MRTFANFAKLRKKTMKPLGTFWSHYTCRIYRPDVMLSSINRGAAFHTFGYYNLVFGLVRIRFYHV